MCFLWGTYQLRTSEFKNKKWGTCLCKTLKIAQQLWGITKVQSGLPQMKKGGAGTTSPSYGSDAEEGDCHIRIPPNK